MFGREYNEALIHQIVVAYQANARQGTRAQKTAKPSSTPPRSPGAKGHRSRPRWYVFLASVGGGGRIFPNSPDENFTQKVNKKMYRAGMAPSFQLAREGRLVVDSIAVEAPKTKLLAAS